MFSYNLSAFSSSAPLPKLRFWSPLRAFAPDSLSEPPLLDRVTPPVGKDIIKHKKHQRALRLEPNIVDLMVMMMPTTMMLMSSICCSFILYISELKLMAAFHRCV